MLNRFMISVAAVALVAGTGLANAQDKGRDSGAGSQQMQQSQPSGGAAERGGSMGRDSMSHDKGTVGQAGGSGAMKSEDKSGAMKDERPSGGAMNKNAAEDKSGTTKGQRTDDRAQGQMDKSQQDKSKSMSQDTSKSGAKDQKDMKAEGSKSGTSTTETQKGTGTSTNQNVQGQTGTSTNQNAQGQTGTSSTQNVQGQSSTTVGQAGAAAKLSTEQRTQITSVIREQRVAPVTNVNFSISVGTRIPREGITLHALPSRVVSIYPEWRAYKYVLVREEIVIIDPDTYEIVAVLNV
ncbi:DUF1236 domain-containing protein [Bradyrhizobium yuanmingense]|uniref:DUF1236 domain-containing protein n=1 Tax=Bradyrhizobium yuanmingense TaxID=108015 RepID=UPI0012F90383|nr:DUF1236 domain-containing protein [Bradyrhizobium yuanmingense]MVT53799.1 DUF1236 domain-containing protein [Bradyrhizobium yuanmingense]